MQNKPDNLHSMQNEQDNFCVSRQLREIQKGCTANVLDKIWDKILEFTGYLQLTLLYHVI